jgi:hypothetical protein
MVRFKSFLYQAPTWPTPRRVAVKGEFHVGEMFPKSIS